MEISPSSTHILVLLTVFTFCCQYTRGRVIVTYAFGDTPVGIKILYQPRDYITYGMAPNGIVSLAKVIYAQASTYSAAQQALSRKSFRTNGIVLEWNAAGNYYHYTSSNENLVLGNYISIAGEFHDSRGRTVFRDNGTFAVSSVVDCWIPIQGLESLQSYLTDCATLFNNDALWPTYSTTLATSQLPTIPQSTEGWQTAASTSYTTSRQPPQFPPVTTFRSFARTSQSRTSQSRTSQSPTSGESEGRSDTEGHVNSETGKISTGVLVAAIVVPFVVIIVIITIVAVICVKKRTAAAMKQSNNAAMRYTGSGGGQINQAMFPSHPAMIQNQSGYPPNMQQFTSQAQSQAQHNAHYADPTNSEYHHYSYIQPYEVGVNGQNLPGHSTTTNQSAPHQLPKDHPSIQLSSVVNHYQPYLPGSMYQGPKATALEDTTSNYYSDIPMNETE